jgi:hypothetical protein
VPYQALGLRCHNHDYYYHGSWDYHHHESVALRAEAEQQRATQMASAVAQAPTLTHLALELDVPQAAMLIAQALPQLRSLYLDQPQMSYVT